MKRRPLVLIAAVLVCAGLVWLVRDLAEPTVQGDGVGLYAPLASLLLDHDLDFRNEFAHSGGSVRRRWLTGPDGRVVNPYPIGAAILWTPPIVIAWLLDPKRESHGDPTRWVGISPAYSRRYFIALAIGTGIEAILGLWLVYRMVRRKVRRGHALLAVAAIALGTPLLFYAVAMPSYAHAASFLVCATFVSVALSPREDRRSLLYLGLLWGLLTIVRYQDAVLGVIAAPRLLREVRNAGRHSARETALRIALFVLPAALVFLPQYLYWRRVYGQALVTAVPLLMNWTKPHFLGFLFSTWQGAILWSPVIALGIVGLRWLEDRSLRWALWLAILLEIYVCAATGDWWGSASCGSRRLVVIAPIIGLGLGLGLQHGFKRRVTFLSPRVRMIVRHSAVALALLWNLRLTQYYAAGLLPINPGNQQNYLRDYQPSDWRARPWGLWDYGRLAAEIAAAERRMWR